MMTIDSRRFRSPIVEISTPSTEIEPEESLQAKKRERQINRVEDEGRWIVFGQTHSTRRNRADIIDDSGRKKNRSSAVCLEGGGNAEKRDATHFQLPFVRRLRSSRLL